MGASYLAGIAFVVAVFGVGVVYSDCNTAAITTCTNNLVQVITGTNIYESEHTLTNFCTNDYGAYKTCLVGNTDGCAPLVKKLFQGIYDSYNYNCGDGKPGALQYGECAEGATNKASIASCTSTLNSRIAGTSDIDTRCGYVDDYLECCEDAAKDNCGNGIEGWYRKNIALSAGPVLEEIGCGCSGLTATLTLLAASFLLQWLVR